MKRRDLLGLGGLTLVGVTLLPASARAEIPKRGGTITLRLWDPPHFDPYLQVSYKTHIVYSFTHSRLVKHRAGPAVVPGTFAIEGDLAESWSQPDETTYVFKLRRGVRWQPKPPVNGRELTAEDVVYSVERFRTIKGNANASMLKPLDRVEAVDRYTVRFTLKEPYAWFLDMLANPMAVCIVARECVEKFGDLKSPEATVGTGPWMLDSYRPNVGMTLVRNPGYFVAGLPYIDRVEIFVDEDNASRIAAFLGGKYDLGCNQTHTYTDDYMMFHRGGATNCPRRSHAIWFLAQYVRFGYLPGAPDYKAIADKLILRDVYADVAKEMGIPIPDDDMKPFALDLDHAVFDPSNPDESLAGFARA